MASWVATASGSADVPPLAAPPGPQTFMLTGVITDATTHAGIGAARVEVLNGIFAGKWVSTDDTGTYVFGDLAPDTFRLRVSAEGYAWGEQNVTVPINPRADFELRRSCGYVLSPASAEVSALFWSGTFTATRAASTACSWTASPSTAWLSLYGAKEGTDTTTVEYLASPTTSAQTRTGTIAVKWSGGVPSGKPEPISRLGLPMLVSRFSMDRTPVPSLSPTATASTGLRAFRHPARSPCNVAQPDTRAIDSGFLHSRGTPSGQCRFPRDTERRTPSWTVENSSSVVVHAPRRICGPHDSACGTSRQADIALAVAPG